MVFYSTLSSSLWLVAMSAFPFWFLTKKSPYKASNEFTVNSDVSTLAKVLNFILWPIFRYKLSKKFEPLDLEVMKREAMEEKDIGTDFGDSEYENTFRIFIDLINKNRSRWTPLGYTIYRSMFLRMLRRRLRFFKCINDAAVMEYMKKNPVKEPIFLFGLPRTGTTFLHRLLSLDPKARAPLMYELLDPVERANDPEKDTAEKIKHFDSQAKSTLAMVPQLSNIHEISAFTPEECAQASMDRPRNVMVWHMMLEYSKKNSRLDTFGELFYRYYHNQLQILTYNSLKSEKVELAQKRWVIKCPGHLASLHMLMKEFPDAKLIWNHRDLHKAIPSLGTMFRLGQDLTQTTCDLKTIGKVVLRYVSGSLTQGEEFVADAKNSCCHVKYDDLISNPINVVKLVYKELGYEYTAEYEKILEAYVLEDKKKREVIKKQTGGKNINNYTLEEFGFTEADIEQFAWYTEKYL